MQLNFLPGCGALYRLGLEAPPPVAPRAQLLLARLLGPSLLEMWNAGQYRAHLLKTLQ